MNYDAIERKRKEENHDVIKNTQLDYRPVLKTGEWMSGFRIKNTVREITEIRSTVFTGIRTQISWEIEMMLVEKQTKSYNIHRNTMNIGRRYR